MTGPSWRRVADDIRTKITAGAYPVGTPIPSTAKLMEQYGVSSTVARHAVTELQAAGIVAGHSGKAVYVEAVPEDADAQRLTTQQLGDQQQALADVVGRLEANLIDLYGKLGYDYPRDEADDQAATGHASDPATRRERLA